MGQRTIKFHGIISHRPVKGRIEMVVIFVLLGRLRGLVGNNLLPDEVTEPAAVSASAARAVGREGKAGVSGVELCRKESEEAEGV